MKYREVFEQVDSFLTERGYDWIADQVREELDTGKLQEERLSTLAESKTEQLSLVGDGDFKKGQSADFIKRAEYSDKEALVLLLEAAKRAICEVSVMAGELGTFLVHNDLGGLTFESERGPTSEDFRISRDAAVQSSIASACAVELDKLIREIRAS